LAIVQPFQAFRYSQRAGDPATLLTQPYDKISPAMQQRYLAASPHNLVRVILGESLLGDNESQNVYTRAAAYFEAWMRDGILTQDSQPGFYAYFQEFDVPDTGERLTRQGFIGLGKVEDYSSGVVFRHEETLTGPKKDRMEVLRHTHAHFGQVFMLYPDPSGDVDREVFSAAATDPVTDVLDEYGARHRLWPITDPVRISRIQALMAPMKLLIADGHHRYETALNYRNDHPGDPAPQFVMMTFINMYSQGVKILATHRVLDGIAHFSDQLLRDRCALPWTLRELPDASSLKRALASGANNQVRIGAVTADRLFLLERPRQPDELDVPVLHHEIIEGWLGISGDAVREEKHIDFVRGADIAIAKVREHGAQVAFLLNPTPMDDMARVAFSGGVMPQKSTDFYPKLLTGMTIYHL